MKQYDVITVLISLDIEQPFTAPDAVEHIGTKLGFSSGHMPTIEEVRTKLPRDSRVVRVGDRGRWALYRFK